MKPAKKAGEDAPALCCSLCNMPVTAMVLLLLLSSSLSLVLLPSLFVSAGPSTVASPAALPRYYDAIFSFGDSFSDTGNFVIMESGKIPNIPKFPPPYARCSNGRLIIDFLAEAFGLPLLPPSQHKEGNFSQGVNFAVMGATTLELSFFTERKINLPPINSSLFNQLEWFDEVRPRICRSPDVCRALFQRSLFIVGEFGGNDYSFTLNSGRPISEVRSLVPLVVPKIIEGIEKLIDQGARHVVVPGNLPTGCVPIMLTFYPSKDKHDYDESTGCLRRLNGIALYHNAMLRAALDELQRRRPEARIIYADYYTPVIQFATHPQLYGFHNGALRVCCGGGGPYNYNMSASCGLPGATVCESPDSHVSWDGIHLTERSYKYITDGWINGPHARPPIAAVLRDAINSS